jgi:hypothetical protein
MALAALVGPEPAVAKGRNWLEAVLPAPADVQTPFGRVRVRAGLTTFQLAREVHDDHATARVPPAKVATLVRVGRLMEGVLDRPVVWSGLEIPAGSEVDFGPESGPPTRTFVVRFRERRTVHGLVLDDLELSFDPAGQRNLLAKLTAPTGDQPAEATLRGVVGFNGALAVPTRVAVGSDAVALPAGARVAIVAPLDVGDPTLLRVDTTPITVRGTFRVRRVLFDLDEGRLRGVGGFGDIVNGVDYTTTADVQGVPVLLQSEVLLYPSGPIREIAPAHAMTRKGWTIGTKGRAHPFVVSLWPDGAPQCGHTPEDAALKSFTVAGSGEVVEGLYPLVLFDPRGQPRLLTHFTNGPFEVLPGVGRARRTLRPIDPGSPLITQHGLEKLGDCEKLASGIVDWLKTH